MHSMQMTTPIVKAKQLLVKHRSVKWETGIHRVTGNNKNVTKGGSRQREDDKLHRRGNTIDERPYCLDNPVSCLNT